jgi:2-polyprenyl-3-methyl-5-hydroxy-6-metoxy-1,4-benzoquinol methylase
VRSDVTIIHEETRVDYRHLRDQNRRSWNMVVPAHNSHRANQEAFFNNGGLTLFPEERGLLGDVAGKTVAHLMCNAGQDTLSLAQLGATVTGVDSSDAAITIGRGLAAKTNLNATFKCMDVYDWLTEAATGRVTFDIVYCAYGVICWLSDLHNWAQSVAAVLKPGGNLVLMEFHPVSNMFDQQWHFAASYPAGGGVVAAHGIDDYVGESLGGLTPSGYAPGVQNFYNSEPCYLFQWGIGEVVTALANAGLTLKQLHEYPYTNGERPFMQMREGEGRRMFPPANIPSIPLMYGLVAQKS